MALRGRALSPCYTFRSKPKRYWLTAVVGLFGTLSACGGGGGDTSSSNAGSGSSGTTGSSGSGVTNSPATLVVSPTAVDVTAPVNGASPQATVKLSIQTSSSGEFYIRSSVTKNGVASGPRHQTLFTARCRCNSSSPLGPVNTTDVVLPR
jgi:hypothetical protein